MNRQPEILRTNDALTPIADLTRAPQPMIERDGEHNASNDENPIAAVDAMALCMLASTFGG